MQRWRGRGEVGGEEGDAEEVGGEGGEEVVAGELHFDLSVFSSPFLFKASHTWVDSLVGGRLLSVSFPLRTSEPSRLSWLGERGQRRLLHVCIGFIHPDYLSLNRGGGRSSFGGRSGSRYSGRSVRGGTLVKTAGAAWVGYQVGAKQTYFQ